MSFILDALKKAESERNRHSGPVLMDVRIAPPRRGLPTWAWVLGAVLLTNLGVLAWMLLRSPEPAVAARQTAEPPPAATAAPPIAAPPVAPAPAPPPDPAAIATLAPDIPPPPPVDDSNRLPTAQDLQAAGVPLPPLQLNMHVYDATPVQRYVLLNAVRLREGEFTPDGIKVERITSRGVVLEASGRRFLLVAGN